MGPDIPYTLLGRSGLRVSTLCLGTMTWWGADKHTGREIFRRFVDRGGNFIDTGGTNEKWVGEFISRDRERFVIGTTYSLRTRPDDANAGGNHRKDLVRSLDACLRRLGTDYVDVYRLNVSDFVTPLDETLRALDDVLAAGKVLYLGVSDTPAWIVAHADARAELRGWPAFVAVQAEYSLARRDAERELLPMARSLGMSLLAWSRNRPTERGLAIAKVVAQAAQDIGCTPSQLALAWLYREASVIPILGCRNADQLEDNLGCLAVRIPGALLRRLDEASRIELDSATM